MSCTGRRHGTVDEKVMPVGSPADDGKRGMDQLDSCSARTPSLSHDGSSFSAIGSRLSFRTTRGSLRRLNRQESPAGTVLYQNDKYTVLT